MQYKNSRLKGVEKRRFIMVRARQKNALLYEPMMAMMDTNVQ